MSLLVWTILYLVSVVGAACVVFLIAGKDVLTLNEAIAGLLIALFWPLIVVIAATFILVVIAFSPLMLLDDYCHKRGWVKDIGKMVVWRRKGGNS